MPCAQIFKAIEHGLCVSDIPTDAQHHIDTPDNDGNTALHIAVAHGRVWWVVTLLRLGASPVVTNNTGVRPVDVNTSIPAVRTLLAHAFKTQPYIKIAQL